MTHLARALTVFAAVGVLHAAVAAQGLPSFHPQDEIATGSFPQSVAIADFDSNGALDLVTANPASDTVSVLLSTVPGSFKAQATFAVGDNPATVAIGDLNGDGYLDLVTGNLLSNDVSVLLGTGTGSFGAPTTFGVGGITGTPAIGDLNGDDIPDLVTIGGLNAVSVLLGTGTGGFGEPTAYDLGIHFGPGLLPWSVAIGDLNGDLNPDIVTTNGNPASLSVLLGSGTGAFGSLPAFVVGGTPDTPAIGDLNGDGHGDLVVPISGSISVLLGTGTGGFGAPTAVSAVEGPIAIGDLNGDGIPDLVTANSAADTVSVLPGTGTGSFGAPATFGVGITPLSIAIKDVNGDLNLDIVTANAGSNSVSVLLNAGSPTPGVPWTYLGHGKTGTGNEMPWLLGNGPLTAGSVNLLSLDNAKPNSYSYFCYGSALDYTPFKGGTMVPASPQYVIVPIASNGSFSIQFQYPTGLSGVPVCLQNWVKDAGATSGYSASNALQVVGQP